MKDIIDEAIDNGYECEFSYTEDNKVKYLTDEVFRKMCLQRHANMGYPLLEAEMLAVIMYTGTDCYADLRMTQQGRNLENEQKWYKFSYTLDCAIMKLSYFDQIKPPRYLYHGLNGVKVIDKGIFQYNAFGEIDDSMGCSFSYSTFVSMTEDHEIAESFMLGYNSHLDVMNQGTIIEVDTNGTV